MCQMCAWRGRDLNWCWCSLTLGLITKIIERGEERVGKGVDREKESNKANQDDRLKETNRQKRRGIGKDEGL